MRKEALLGVFAAIGTIIGVGVLCWRADAD
jgi:hypothetical protein